MILEQIHIQIFFYCIWVTNEHAFAWLTDPSFVMELCESICKERGIQRSRMLSERWGLGEKTILVMASGFSQLGAFLGGSGLTVAHSEAKGRCLVASRFFGRGEKAVFRFLLHSSGFFCPCFSKVTVLKEEKNVSIQSARICYVRLFNRCESRSCH